MHLSNEIIFVCGQRGSGKSYFTKKLSLSFPRCIIFDSLGEYNADRRIYDLEELVDFLQSIEHSTRLFTVAYDSTVGQEDFPLFCRAILATGNIHLIVEEIDLYSNGFKTDPEFLKLLKYGRHYGIQIVGVSRRPAEVSRNFTAQTTRFVCFQNREPIDIKYFKSIFGKEAEKIAILDRYHYLDIDFSISDPDFSIHPPISS